METLSANNKKRCYVEGKVLNIDTVTFDINDINELYNMDIDITILDKNISIKDVVVRSVKMTHNNCTIKTNTWKFIQTRMVVRCNDKLLNGHLDTLKRNTLSFPLFFNLNEFDISLSLSELENKSVRIMLELESEIINKCECYLRYEYADIDTKEIKRNYICKLSYPDITVKYEKHVCNVILPFSGNIGDIIFKLNYNDLNDLNDIRVTADLYINNKLYKTVSNNGRYQPSNINWRSDEYNSKNYFAILPHIDLLNFSGSLSAIIVNPEDQLKLCIQTSCESGEIYITSLYYTVI